MRSTSLSMGWTISGMLARPTAVGNVLAIKLGAFFNNSRVVAVMLWKNQSQQKWLGQKHHLPIDNHSRYDDGGQHLPREHIAGTNSNRPLGCTTHIFAQGLVKGIHADISNGHAIGGGYQWFGYYRAKGFAHLIAVTCCKTVSVSVSLSALRTNCNLPM